MTEHKYWHTDEPKQVVKKPEPPNPLFQTAAGWFFFDQTWMFHYGPYPTKEEAEVGLKTYADTI